MQVLVFKICMRRYDGAVASSFMFVYWDPKQNPDVQPQPRVQDVEPETTWDHLGLNPRSGPSEASFKRLFGVFFDVFCTALTWERD